MKFKACVHYFSTDWQNGDCPYCEINRLEQHIKELEAKIHKDCFYHGGCGCMNLRLGVKEKEK